MHTSHKLRKTQTKKYRNILSVIFRDIYCLNIVKCHKQTKTGSSHLDCWNCTGNNNNLSPCYFTTMNDSNHDFPWWQWWLPFIALQQQIATDNNNNNSPFTTSWLTTTSFHHKSPFIASQLMTTFLHCLKTYLSPFPVSSHNVFPCQWDKKVVSLQNRFTWQSCDDMSHSNTPPSQCGCNSPL